MSRSGRASAHYDAMAPLDDKTAQLRQGLGDLGEAVVCFSGGVDSGYLLAEAVRVLGDRAVALTAVSPSLAPEEGAAARRLASDLGARHLLVDTAEVDDPRYAANPVNRCYFCKTNLYSTIAPLAGAGTTVLSGTNTDDLGDFRPGLAAAAEHGVRHPYVECGIDKPAVRAIATRLGLHDLAELPAAPCLSSRVETGIAIDPAVLAAVDACERIVRDATGAGTVRCRVRRDAVVVELDDAALSGLDGSRRATLAGEVQARMTAAGVLRALRFEPYRMGSAFLKPSARATAAS